jgi:transporter family-2 protein
MPSQASLYALMFVAGCSVPTMAAINSGLGARLGSPLTAVLVLTATATLIAAVAMLLTSQSPSGWGTVRPWQWLGGALFLVYIFSATYAVPHIGLGNAIFIVLIGQLITAAVIDHFGLLGVVQSPVTARRALGLALMAIGVLLARKDVLLP